MAAERYYQNGSQTEAWRVDDKQTRYVRVIAKNTVTGEEDFCLCTKTTSQEDEAYIKSYATPGSWDVFFHLLSQLLLTMERKKKETEKFFGVEIK